MAKAVAKSSTRLTITTRRGNIDDAKLHQNINHVAVLWRRADRLAEIARPGTDAFDDYQAVSREAFELEEQIRLASVHSARGFKAKCEALDKDWIDLDFLTVFRLGRDAERLGLNRCRSGPHHHGQSRRCCLNRINLRRHDLRATGRTGGLFDAWD